MQLHYRWVSRISSVWYPKARCPSRTHHKGKEVIMHCQHIHSNKPLTANRIVVGIPTILRDGDIEYLSKTLQSLLHHMSEEDKSYHRIIIFNAETEERNIEKLWAKVGLFHQLSSEERTNRWMQLTVKKCRLERLKCSTAPRLSALSIMTGVFNMTWKWNSYPICTYITYAWITKLYKWDHVYIHDILIIHHWSY